MEKKTQAQKNEEIRNVVVGKLGLELIDGLVKIAGSKYAIDIPYDNDYIKVRIDVVVPKDQETSALDDNELYLETLQAKEEEKQEKLKAKEKKIARDIKARAKKKEEEGQ